MASIAAVTLLACVESTAGAVAQPAVREVYSTYCGLEDKPGKCELRTMSENLAGSETVSTVPAWFSECGPSNGHPPTTVSADGTTAVTLEDTSAAPGAYGDSPICRLAVTNLGTGQSHVLPAYSPALLSSIEVHGWTISPNGQDIALTATNGVYVQDVQAGTPPQLLRTGFTPQSVGWYPDSSRLLIAGPAVPLGGRGALNTANRLFEFTLSGHVLGDWLVQSPARYQFDVPFIDIGSTGQVYVAGGTTVLPGATPNMPSGYYLLRLGGHVATQLIARVSQRYYEGSVSSFGVDSASGLVFISGENQVCSVSIAQGTHHCVSSSGFGVQVALPPS